MIDWTKYSYKVEGKKTSRRKKTYTRPCYNVIDVYRLYRTLFPNKGQYHGYIFDFKEIIFAYNKALSQEILDGKVIDLPYKLGKISVKRKKVNYTKLLKNKFMVSLNPYYLKPEADGWFGFWAWEKKGCKVEGSKVYSFTETYPNKVAVSSIMQIPNNFQRYYPA